MALSKVAPLAWNAPIVDEHGNPTPYFQRQLAQLLNEKAATDALAEAAVPGTRLVSAGTGLTGGGALTSDITLNVDTTAEAERIRDVIGTALVAGTNITITVNDGGDTITITATGGGGGAQTLITEQVLTVDGNFADFTSIPTTYRDLVLVIRGRSSAAAVESQIGLRLNGDSGANYDYGNNAMVNGITFTSQAIASTQMNIGAVPGNTSPASTAGTMEAVIGDYKGTTFHKAVKGTAGDKKANSSGQIGFWGGYGIWRNTAAVTSITITTGFKAGSIASLYGRM